MNEVKEHLGSEVDSKNLLLLARLKPWLANVGLVDPGMQIYVEVRSTPRLPELVFLLILCGLAKLTFSPCAGTLNSAHQFPLDTHVSVAEIVVASIIFLSQAIWCRRRPEVGA